MPMRFWIPVLLVCLLIATGNPASQPQPGPKKDQPRLDHYGDPLPDHALLRIGTTRLRPNVAGGGYLRAMAFTKEGQHLVTMSDWIGGQLWDAATGKRVQTFGKPASLG